MTLVAEQTDKQCFSNRWTSLRLPDALEDRRVAYKENLGHPPAIYPPTLTSMSLFSKNVPLVSQAELTKCSGSSEESYKSWFALCEKGDPKANRLVLEEKLTC